MPIISPNSIYFMLFEIKLTKRDGQTDGRVRRGGGGRRSDGWTGETRRVRGTVRRMDGDTRRMTRDGQTDGRG